MARFVWNESPTSESARREALDAIFRAVEPPAVFKTAFDTAAKQLRETGVIDRVSPSFFLRAWLKDVDPPTADKVPGLVSRYRKIMESHRSEMERQERERERLNREYTQVIRAGIKERLDPQSPPPLSAARADDRADREAAKPTPPKGIGKCKNRGRMF